MTLKKFAKNAGVKVFKCDKVKWGGSFGYKTDDCPNSSVCGFWSEEDCYISWLKVRLGKRQQKQSLNYWRKQKTTLRNDRTWRGLFADGYLKKIMSQGHQPSVFDFGCFLSSSREYEVKEVFIEF